MSHLNFQFHRAQSRLKSNPRRSVSGQSDVAPLFHEPATGDSSYYEIPAYMRKRVQQLTLENASRLAAYVDRVQADIQEQAA